MNNNCCNPCADCKRRLSSTSVAVSGSTLNVDVTIDGALKPETKYCLILCQPVPVSGYNLPVNIVVTSLDADDITAVPLKKLYTANCGFCNLEFGEDLPKCRNRVPLYYTNGNDFIDIRGGERRHYCG